MELPSKRPLRSISCWSSSAKIRLISQRVAGCTHSPLMMSCNACLLLVSPCHPNSCLAHVCGVVTGPQFWRLVSAGSLACCFLSTCLEGNKKSRDISSHIMTHDTRLAASQAFQETKCLPNVGSGALVLASLQGARSLATRIVHQTSSNMILGQNSNTGMCTLK